MHTSFSNVRTSTSFPPTTTARAQNPSASTLLPLVWSYLIELDERSEAALDATAKLRRDGHTTSFFVSERVCPEMPNRIKRAFQKCAKVCSNEMLG